MSMNGAHDMIRHLLLKVNPNTQNTFPFCGGAFNWEQGGPCSRWQNDEFGRQHENLRNDQWPGAIQRFVTKVNQLRPGEINEVGPTGQTLLDVSFNSMLQRAGLGEVFELEDRTFLPTVELIRPMMEADRLAPLYDLSQHIESGEQASKYIDRALSFSLYLIGAGADLSSTIERALTEHGNGLELLEVIVDAMTLLYNGYYAVQDANEFPEKKCPKAQVLAESISTSFNWSGSLENKVISDTTDEQ